MRILNSLLALWGVLTFTFFLIHFIPGDPAELILGERASPSDIAALRHELRLDAPLALQYFEFLTQTLKGHWGYSFTNKRPVLQEISSRLPATLELGSTVFLASLVLGVFLGVGVAASSMSISGTKSGAKRWSEALFLNATSLAMAVPSFILGPSLIYFFSFRWGWLPINERENFLSLILPALTLGLGGTAAIARMTMNSLKETLHQDYIRTAKAKGLGDFTILFKHALRNAGIPIVALLGMHIGSLLTGAVITETIFDWPGIGTLLFSAIQQRNFPVIQGCVLLIALIYISTSLLTDLVMEWIDPRAEFL